MSFDNHPVLYCAEIAFGIAGGIFCFIGCYRQWRRPHAPKQFAEGALDPLVFSSLLISMAAVVDRLAVPRELWSNYDVFRIWASSLLFVAFVVYWVVTRLKKRGVMGG